MRFGRGKFGIGVVTVGAVMALAPAAPSWAATTSKGSNPNAPLCRLEKAGIAAESKSSATAEAALTAGNWKKAQKALLSEIGLGTKFEHQAVAALSSAPANVKAATTVVLKFAAVEKTSLQKAKSEAAFEKADQKAASASKLQKAEQTLSTYQMNLCGSVTPTT